MDVYKYRINDSWVVLHREGSRRDCILRLVKRGPARREVTSSHGRQRACPDHLHVQLLARPTAVVMSRLEVEADEMWSCVQKKADKHWIWSAMDATTRQIIAFHGAILQAEFKLPL